MLPKAAEPAKTVASEAREREHSSKLSALSNFSLGDMLDGFRDGPKSVKFPEKLLKVLEQKLQDIAMGKDSACVTHRDSILRYGNTDLLAILAILISWCGEPWQSSMVSSWWTALSGR